MQARPAWRWEILGPVPSSREDGCLQAQDVVVEPTRWSMRCILNACTAACGLLGTPTVICNPSGCGDATSGDMVAGQVNHCDLGTMQILNSCAPGNGSHERVCDKIRNWHEVRCINCG